MIRIREILQATLLRFLPVLAGGSVAIALLLNRGTFVLPPARVALGLSALIALEALGFAAFLWQARYRLRSTADVTGRRSAVAGGLAIAGLVAAVAGQPVWSVAPYLSALA